MRLIDVIPSTRKGKKYTAIFCECEGKSVCTKKKKVHFGSAGSQTYLDHRDEKKKENYIARHRASEDWNDRVTPGALSYHLLWNKPTLKESIADFRKRFKC